MKSPSTESSVPRPALGARLRAALDAQGRSGKPWPLLLAFAVLCLAWGSTWLLGKRALAYTPPLMFVGVRSFAGGLILLCACRFQRPPRWRLLWPGAVLMTAVNFGLMAWGMLRIPSGLAATVNLATVPLAVLLLAGRFPGRVQWAGLLAGGVGLALVYFNATTTMQHNLSWGVLAIAAGAACYGAGTVLMKKVAAQGSVVQLAAWHSLAGGAILLLLSLLEEPWDAQVWLAVTQPDALANLFAIILLSTVLGLSLYLLLLRHWSASAVASYAYVCPVVALAIGSAFGGERLEARQLLACAILIAAAAATNVRPTASARALPATAEPGA